MWEQFYSANQELIQSIWLSVGSFLAVFVALFGIKRLLIFAVSRTPTRLGISRPLAMSLERISAFTLGVVAAYIALQRFEYSDQVAVLLKTVTTAVVTFQILVIVTDWVRYALSEDGFVPLGASHLRTIRSSLISIAIMLVWVLGILIMLDNLGFNVAAIIAGLGIGGLAVGLALQSVFKDLIACFSIGFDKPFEVGDFIIAGDLLGTVQQVGLKTTRIRSLNGEMLVTPNSNLVNTNIQNYKDMKERRIVFTFGVTYDIDQNVLASIPEMVRETITEIDDTRFDRAHFLKFGEFSLTFEVVYYVLSPDYNKYMDIQQKINLRLRERLIDQGAAFALPVQAIELNLEQVRDFMKTAGQLPGDSPQDSDTLPRH